MNLETFGILETLETFGTFGTRLPSEKPI